MSESKFVAGVQVPKHLYLLVHGPELATEPAASAKAIIQQGRDRAACPEVGGSRGLEELLSVLQTPDEKPFPGLR
jgi:hypothetical protein